MMKHENDDAEDDSETCFGSQNLFSQTPSLSPTNELAPHCSTQEHPSSAVKAILQMLHLYENKLQKAQSKVKKQLDWVVIPSTKDYPDELTTLVNRRKTYGNVAITFLSEADDESTESDDVCVAKRRQRRGKTSVLNPNPKVADIFKFKVIPGKNLLLSVPKDTEVDEPKSKESPRKGLFKKGTTWLKSKIGLKRKSSNSSGSDDDFDDTKRKKESIIIGERSTSKVSSGHPNKMINTNRVGQSKNREIGTSNAQIDVEKGRLERAQYSTVDVDDDDDVDDSLSGIREQHATRSTVAVVDLESNSTKPKTQQQTVVHKGQKVYGNKIERKIPCPLCKLDFSSSVINDHAFTCDGTKQRDTRAYTGRRMNHESPPTVKESIPRKEEIGKSYPAFESACKKVLPQKGSDREKLLSSVPSRSTSGKSTVSDANSKGGIKEETKILTPLLQSKDTTKSNVATNGHCNVVEKQTCGENHETGFYGQKNGKETVILNVASAESTKQPKDEWISEDSDEREDLDTTSDILHQYLVTSPDAQKREMKRTASVNGRQKQKLTVKVPRKRAEDMEKCFICQKSFPSGKEYRNHVEEEMDRLEREGGQERTHETEPEPTHFRTKEKTLQDNLGNRESWTEGKLVRNDRISEGSDDDTTDGGTIKVSNVSDSPIKNFKFIDESSEFDFCGQFQARPKRRRENTSYKKPSMTWRGKKRRKK